MDGKIILGIDNGNKCVKSSENYLSESGYTRFDFEPISKQAHFLKSSVGIIKIKDMHDAFKAIEMMGKEKRDREEIERLLQVILETFAKAKPIIKQRMKSK